MSQKLTTEIFIERAKKVRDQEESRHEVEFDIVFLILNTLALIFGCWYLINTKDYAWISFLTIEFLWAFDNMRHNRS